MIKTINAKITKAFLVIVLVLGFWLVAPRAYAVSVMLVPTGIGSSSNLVPNVAGSQNFAMVNEATCDGKTTYNFASTSGLEDSYKVSLDSIPNNSTITNIKIYSCVALASTQASSTPSVFESFYKVNGTTYSAGSFAPKSTFFTNYSTSTQTQGFPLVKSSITNLELGVKYMAGKHGLNVSRVGVYVYYKIPVPPAPVNVSATLGAFTSSSTPVTVAWEYNASNTPVSGFVIERSNGGSFAVVGNVGAEARTFVNAFSSNTVGNFVYRVKAYNSSGNSAYSENSNSVQLPKIAELQVMLDASSTPAQIIAPGTVGFNFGTWKFAEITGNEGVKVNQLIFTAKTTTASNSTTSANTLKNFKLLANGQLVASQLSWTAIYGQQLMVAFNALNIPVIAQGFTRVSLVADVATSAQGAINNSVWKFEFAQPATDIQAVGLVSALPIPKVVLGSMSNPITVVVPPIYATSTPGSTSTPAN
jgi:hypothetical protein